MNEMYKGQLKQGMKFILSVIFLIITFFSNMDASLSLAKGQTLGELMLKGEHVEHLVLREKNGRTERFDKPGETIELTAGQYQLQESHLDGGYVCFQRAGLQDGWVTVTENKPAVLEVGAPLKQTLEVKRRGKALVLDYKLLGIGGEAYTKNARNKPPRLIVYNGEEEINSGRFEYG